MKPLLIGLFLLTLATGGWAQDELEFPRLEGPRGPVISTQPEKLPLPELGGMIVAPRVRAGDTQPLRVTDWTAGIDYLRPFFAADNPWYQGISAANDTFGAKAFLDYHYGALERLRARIVANGDGEFPVRPIAEYEYLNMLIPLLPLGAGPDPFSTAPRALTDAERAEIFALRLFDGLPSPSQDGLGRLTLSHSARPLPNGIAVNVPFRFGEAGMSEPYRRVSFLASRVGDIPVDRVRFEIAATGDVDILTERADCTTGRPIYCEMWGPEAFEISLLLQPPDFDGDARLVTHRADVTVALWRDGAWQDEATDWWALDFGRCDLEYQERVRNLMSPPANLRGLFDRLTELALQDEGLPGRRLYPGPTRGPIPPDTETRDIPADPRARELAALIDDLARNRGLDEYFAGTGNLTGGLYSATSAAQQITNMRQCDRPRQREQIDKVDVEIRVLEERIRSYERWLSDTALRRAAWVERVDSQYRDIQSLDEVVSEPNEEMAEFIEGLGDGAFQKLLATRFMGAEFATGLGQVSGVLTLILSGVEIVIALREAYDLFDWRETIIEATAYMESEAYLRGMIGKYEFAKQELEVMRAALLEPERDACYCYLPAERN